jgi:cell division protein FtsQ
MTKKQKKKKINLFKVFIFLIILFLITISIKLLFDVKTKNIIILNNNYYSDEQIIEAANLEKYPKFLLLNKSKVKSKLKKLDLIEDATINKKKGFVLEIDVKEKKILYLKRSINEYVLSDKSTIPLDDVVGVPTLINFLEEDTENKFIEEFSKIDTSIISLISEIEYNKTDYDSERFLLYMNDGNEVYITISKLNKLNKYESIVSKLNGKRGILYLDSGNYLEVKE